ncbi:Uncharacterized protein PBTT_06579 [Plasmodiophora brassicae]|uniref:Uncharacterized protein n=1 Tax=Plasmodiophora brassicae TaxID=37360 RepID=A0A0G4IVB4_PLABS|nr:hypothetical protein PBRA_001174 [Plasmodiophora brassicae]SPQ97281.1 unnamed protein product [Plasmodiophora brassicae]
MSASDTVAGGGPPTSPRRSLFGSKGNARSPSLSSLSKWKSRLFSSTRSPSMTEFPGERESIGETTDAGQERTISDAAPVPVVEPSSPSDNPRRKLWRRLRSLWRLRRRSFTGGLREQHPPSGQEQAVPGTGHPPQPAANASSTIMEQQPKKPRRKPIRSQRRPRRPDDWFYQRDREEMAATIAKRNHLIARIEQDMANTCTFSPRVPPMKTKRKLLPFHQRQRRAYEARVAERIERDRIRAALAALDEPSAPPCHDLNGVYDRSLAWNDVRMEKRIVRGIDQRIQHLSACTFKPVMDWKHLDGGTADGFGQWKSRTAHSDRSKLYLELSDGIRMLTTGVAQPAPAYNGNRAS